MNFDSFLSFKDNVATEGPGAQLDEATRRNKLRYEDQLKIGEVMSKEEKEKRVEEFEAMDQ